MANTFTQLYYHIVFSTKNRERRITGDIQPRLWAYIGGIARSHNMVALEVGGMHDHAHVLLLAKPTIAVSHAVQLIKGASSRWIHEEFPMLNKFSWQDGYGAFTVSPKAVERTAGYIRDQAEHHRHRTFTEEYLKILSEHGIVVDERYVWG
jgi:REP element-mobilizing transposase RayT